MAIPALKLVPVVPAVEKPCPLPEQLPPGRLVEISGERDSARLTMAVAIVRQAQHQGETAAWVQPAGGSLFPPDLDENGVDLESLIIIHVPLQAGPYGVPRAAELLLRSGGFGLVVLDLTGPQPRSTAQTQGVAEQRNTTWQKRLAWQGRLAGLARQHNSRVMCLTDTPARGESLGSPVALRVQPGRVRVGKGLFSIKPRILKNKVGLPPVLAEERRRGPWGLE